MEDLETRLQNLQDNLKSKVKQLAITIQDETCILDGVCASFYHKQLTSHATMQALPQHRLTNRIIVI